MDFPLTLTPDPLCAGRQGSALEWLDLYKAIFGDYKGLDMKDRICYLFFHDDATRIDDYFPERECVQTVPEGSPLAGWRC